MSDEVGEVSFVLVRESPGYSGLRARTYDHPVTTEDIRVKVRMLDEFRSELAGLRYIKIDCEGGEYGVLRGAHEVISENRPIVSFECGDASLINYSHASGDIYDFFEALSYRIVSIEGARLERSGFVEASAKQSFWDYIAYPD